MGVVVTSTKFWVVGLLLSGVVLVSSGFGVVASVPPPAVASVGGVCSKAGANVVVKGVLLVCKSVGGNLVWRVVKASTVTTVVTTTPTTVVSVLTAPRVVSTSMEVASSDSSHAVFTIADMSPDTGVYAVQWVLQGSSFNKYEMMRATSKTITVSHLSCATSYTLRVYVMPANWLLADGHQTQNVTAHSATFDLTMPACTKTAAGVATTVSALTCATGGVCVVGDTGPGGGIVFYVQASGGTFACGVTLASTCKYLEAAPTTGTNAWTDAFYRWSAVENTAVGDTARNTAVGTGYKNTTAMNTQDSTASKAGTIALAYRGPNNLSDWYLPSKDELNQMCKWQRNVAWTSDATVCTGGTLNAGTNAAGFLAVNYWSSTENSHNTAFYQNFDNTGTQGNSIKRSPDGSGVNHYVRPVRAFG